MAPDIMGQVYEYFLGMFASAEGKRGGQFYTPASIIKTLVAVLAPHTGKVYDPCCGSGGMFVQSERVVQAGREARIDHANRREVLGTCDIKNSIWSAKMRRLRSMKSSHRLGM